MQKKQNTRRVLADSVHKIFRAGMMVHAGFIVGFDSEKSTVADAMVELIEAAAIPVCMVGLLFALPTTQLTRRLEKEGRLLPEAYVAQMAELGGGDQCALGLNFHTARPRRDILEDLKQILQRAYDPDVYYGRVRKMARMLDRPVLDRRRSTDLAQRILGISLRELNLGRCILWHVVRRRRELLRHFLRTIYESVRTDPASLPCVFTMTLMYCHLGPFARHVAALLDRRMALLPADERGVEICPIAEPKAELAAAQ
jgi:hypothetical protein